MKIGEAIIEVAQLYNEVEKILKQSNKRYYLATASRKITQELIYYISGLEEGSAGLIPVHSLFFPDYESFIRLNPKNFIKSIQQNLIKIKGNFDIIKDLAALSQEKLEPYFVVLDFEMNARIKTFPRHNIRASAESLFMYLKEKYNLPINERVPENIVDIEKEFVHLIKLIDKKNYV